jgi:hypothetical protein
MSQAEKEFKTLCFIFVIIMVISYSLGNLIAKQEFMQTYIPIKIIEYFADRPNVTGIYYHSAFPIYCVSIKDHDIDRIKGTEIHEVSHALIDFDEEHFCNHNDTSRKYQEFKK